MNSAFYGASNMTVTATDAPVLSGVTDMSNMFRASGIGTTGNLNAWDVSTVTNMNYMFSATPNFNQNIGNWNTSNVTDMVFLFHLATSFNQNI